MKKSKFASFAMLSMVLACAAAGAQTVDNWRTPYGVNVKDASGHCWRDANWTPATAAPDCDGAIVKVSPAPMAAAAAPMSSPAPMAAAAPVVSRMAVKINADALFDFDKSVIRSGAKVRLDNLVAEINSHKAKSVSVEVVGHTDSVGTDAYNQKLSQRRAEAVKAYLVSKGLSSGSIQATGKGEASPVEGNSTAAGRSANRRVDIDVRIEH